MDVGVFVRVDVLDVVEDAVIYCSLGNIYTMSMELIAEEPGIRINVSEIATHQSLIFKYQSLIL